MKQLLSSLCGMLMCIAAFTQVPAQINYQGIARNPGGNVFPNQSMTLRLRIHDGSSAGPVVYSETRNVTTNSFGLFNVAIGSAGASSVTGSIAGVNWSVGAKYLQVELDPNGGSSFTNMGTSQLLSVPYALYAGGAPPTGAAGGDLTGNYPNPTVARIRGVNVNPVAPVLNQVMGFDGTNWTPVSLATHPDNYWRANGSNIYNANAGNVGIGILTPAEKLDVNGNLKTLGFRMPTGAGAGKFLMSDAAGFGSWSSTIAATSIILPYKDSASSETEHIFHIIQISPTSSTAALYGVTRSAGNNATGVGGVVSDVAAGGFSAGVRGENRSTTGSGIGVYGSQNGSGWGVYGTTPSGIGVRGTSNSLYGVYGSSNTLTGVFGYSTASAGYRGGVFGYSPSVGGNGTFGYATRPDGFGALGISDSSIGVYGQSNAATFAALANDGIGVKGFASRAGVGVYGNSFEGNAGLFENTNSGNLSDVLIAQTNSTGIPAAIHGINGSSIIVYGARKGVWGESDNGAGVFGASETSSGVVGAGNSGIGVYGASFTGFAAMNADHFGNGFGLHATSFNGIAGKFETNFSNNSDVLQAITSATGRSGFFQNTNASNNSTTLEVNSIGQGKAIVGRSNFVGFINAGVIDGFTNVVGANAVFGRATRPSGWGIYGLSDSSAGVAGIGIRPGSIGIYGQAYQGTAAQFVIDNSFPNTSNAVEVSNSQSGHGVVVNLNNSARGLNVMQGGNGIGVYANSSTGFAGFLENTNAANAASTLEVISNGTGRAIRARSNFVGFINAGVIDGFTNVLGANAVFGRATRTSGWGVYGLSDSSAAVAGIGIRSSSIGIYGQSYEGAAGQFVIDNTLPNTSNALEVSNTQSGHGIAVNVGNSAHGINVVQGGNGVGVYSNSSTGTAGFFENTNASNATTTLDVISNGTGRAIRARSNLPGAVNAGVIDGFTNILGGNAIFGRANRIDGWGIYGLSDSSVGVAGFGIRPGSTGILGQSYQGVAAHFVIDNSLVNNNNVVEVSTTQAGNGVVVSVNNSSNGLHVQQNGNGMGIFSSSDDGISGRFQNTNAGNANNVLSSSTNGMGRSFEGIINNVSNTLASVKGESNGVGYGVAGVGTNNNTTGAGVYGLHTGALGNGVTGWGTRALTYGTIGHSDSSVGIYGESQLGNAGFFYTYGFNANVPALFAHSNGISNVASFMMNNSANTADAVVINRQGAGRSLFVDGAAFANSMNYYNPVATGKSTVRAEGRQGFAIFGHAGGTFLHGGTQRVAVGVYGLSDSVGSEINYGVSGTGRGATGENAGIVGYIDANAHGTVLNAAIYGFDFGGAAPRYAGLFTGDVQVVGNLSKGGGSFKIDHPQDPENKYLVHSFVESPDMMNVYNGNIVTDADGKAIVKLPEYFEAENIDFKYQLTVIGQFSQAIIGEEIKDNHFVIMTDKPNVKVSWQVTGVRNDKWAQKNRIIPEVDKTATEKGKYLYPELYGQRREEGITFMKTVMPRMENNKDIKQNRQETNDQAKVIELAEQKRKSMITQAERAGSSGTIAEQRQAEKVMEPSPSVKTKRISEMMDISEEQIQHLPTAKTNSSVNEKAKLLSGSIQVDEKIKETEKISSKKELSSSTGKANRLSNNTEPVEERSGSQNPVVKPSADSLLRMKARVPANELVPLQNSAERKNLLKPDIQIPSDQNGKENDKGKTKDRKSN